MGIIVVLFFSMSTTNQNLGHIDIDMLKGQLLGNWFYYISLIDNQEIDLPCEKHLPVYRMSFNECQDNMNKSLPERVVEMRKNNPFNGLCCTTYLNKNVKLDTYYPVVNNTNRKDVKKVSVTNYGNRYKRDYFIEKVGFDTLVIFDERYFFVDGIKYKGVKHIYIKNPASARL
jgi:hypothetical protein